MSVYICYVSAGNLAPAPPSRPFFIQLLQYTLQRETWGGSEVVKGEGESCIAAGEIAEKGFSSDTYGEQLSVAGITCSI